MGLAVQGVIEYTIVQFAAAEMVISALASLDCLAIVFVQFSQLRFETLHFLSHYLPIRKHNLEITNSQVS